ncbi:MAG: hypothetical protein QXT67_08865, partial [Candidatus Bathyarchaeia archaeon]
LDGDYVWSLAVSGNYLYAGLYSMVVKIDLDTFTRVDTLTLNDGEYASSLAVSGNYLYAGLATVAIEPGKIVKIDLDTFTRVDTLTLNDGEYHVWSLAVSGNYLYAGLLTEPGIIVRVRIYEEDSYAGGFICDAVPLASMFMIIIALVVACHLSLKMKKR